MWLFQAFWFFYLAMTFLFEHGMLSMFDVIEERFGFMLVFGDYGLVPFFYCIGGFAILTRPEPLGVGAAVAITLLFAFGYWVFRGANGQKNQFKADPSRPIWGKAPETVGGRLLVSGFWGIGRKLNYTGEILAYIAIALTAGFHSPWPYALPLWLLSLLLHRAHRDDKRCRAKYGALWEAYCARARFRMFPFIY
jgi:delta14-sterol reductase